MALLKEKAIIIYGLGEDYKERKEFYQKEFNIVGYSDSKKFDMDKFIPSTELPAAKFDYIYITTRKYYREIKDTLLGMGIRAGKIISEAFLVYLMLEKKQYSSYEPFRAYPYYYLPVGQGTINVSIHHNNIYEPVYPNCNEQCLMPEAGPEIYNKDGRKLETFFIRANDLPSGMYKTGKYFVWDHYNWKLETHFYFHHHIIEQFGKPKRKYAFLSEAAAIYPELYENLRNNIEIFKEFDAVFTHDEKLLEQLPNAKYNYRGAMNWYGMNQENEKDIEDNYKNKKKNVSIIASNKSLVPMHTVRQETARKCKREGLADTYGTFDGGKYFERYEEPFKEYRYQIVIENSVSPYYFTEKITSCIAAQTIPIYLGAPKIGDFFNMDGIIPIEMKDLDHIDEILKQCTEQEYERRLPAVLENYYRLRDEYKWCTWDCIYEKYLLR